MLSDQYSSTVNIATRCVRSGTPNINTHTLPRKMTTAFTIGRKYVAAAVDRSRGVLPKGNAVV